MPFWENEGDPLPPDPFGWWRLLGWLLLGLAIFIVLYKLGVIA